MFGVDCIQYMEEPSFLIVVGHHMLSDVKDRCNCIIFPLGGLIWGTVRNYAAGVALVF